MGGGRIVNVVPEVGGTAPASWTFYMAGKGAMVGLSKSLAAELSPENITMNMVAPGWIAEDKLEAQPRRERPGQLRRHASGEEIGNTCALLLSDLAACVTGSYLVVSGSRATPLGT
jgi:3-oxoacyl-[acyl-carrier protein] reductase